MPGVFAVNPGDDERSAGLAAAVDAERWLRSSGLVLDESFPDGTQSPQLSKTETVNPAKLDAAVRGMTPVDGETPVAVGSSGGNEPDTEETFDPNRTSHVGQYALRRLYRESTRSALVVLYTADGCGPCGRLRPIIRRVVDEYADSVHFVEIDVDVDKDIAEGAGVLGTPCVHVFKARERVAVVSGVKMRSAYRKAIDSCLEVNAVAEP
jgi:thioredoxin reductase (NADPH)